MIKAVFIDYTGTTVKNGGYELLEFGRLVVENSDFTCVKEFLRDWYSLWRSIEIKCYKETYMTSDEILDYCLNVLVNEYNLNYDLNLLKDLVHGFWSNAPIYDDALEFFNKVNLPIYVLTNNAIKYVDKSMKSKGLKPKRIISSDEVNAYKPHIELFNYALNIAKCKPSEVIHIGDSLKSDYYGAINAGINAYLVLRKEDNSISKDVRVVTNIVDVLNDINNY